MAYTKTPAVPLLIILLSSIATTAPLQAAPINLYYNAQQQPKSWIDKRGEARGWAYEIAAAILQQAEVEFTPKAVPFFRGIHSTKVCNGMMTGVFKTKLRQQILKFSQPIATEQAVVVSRIQDPFHYLSLKDLSSRKVVYLHGESFGDPFEYIAPNLNSVTRQNPIVMLRLLTRKRVDLVILNPGSSSVEFAAKSANIALNQLKIAAIPLAEIKSHLVFCKNNPELYTPIIGRINQAIKDLKKDGSIDKIMRRY